MAKAFGIITSSPEHKVAGMQDYRPIGAFSILGRYRVIDFPISNFSNSGIINLQVYISSKPRSLAAHIGTGRHYNINSKRGRLQLVFPVEEEFNQIYRTNIAALASNIDYIERQSQEYVVIAPSCMVFKQDFDALLQDHAQSGADVTLLYHNVDDAKHGYSTCNELKLDGNRVKAIVPNLADEDNKAIFMETFVMKKTLLLDLIKKAQATSSMYSLANIVNHMAGELDLRAVEHKGFFAPITSLKSYFFTQMRLGKYEIASELFTPDWPIYTRTSDSAPTRYFEGAKVVDSMISNGCKIEGTVEGSTIARGVEVAKGATVKNCVVLAYVKIGEGAYVENQVIDKYATIAPGRKIVADIEQPGYIKHSDKV